MKQAYLAPLALLAMTSVAGAAETVTRADDPALNLRAAWGKQINVRFSEGFAKDRLASPDIDGVIVYEVLPDKVCLYGRGKGLEPDAPALKEFARPEGGDICVPRADVSIRNVEQTAEGAPPAPFYATDKKDCDWVWKTGKGIGLWTEACSFGSGKWDVIYDEANDWFALRVDQGEPFAVLRQFRAEGPDALLPVLREKGLVSNDPECVFQAAKDQPVPAGWTGYNVMPTGKLKEKFDAVVQVEVPEPPCGELGYAVDYVGFFMTNKDHPDRVLFVNLGQDGTMIDPASITLSK